MEVLEGLEGLDIEGWLRALVWRASEGLEGPKGWRRGWRPGGWRRVWAWAGGPGAVRGERAQMEGPRKAGQGQGVRQGGGGSPGGGQEGQGGPGAQGGGRG